MRLKQIGFHAPKQIHFRHRAFNLRISSGARTRYPKHLRQFFQQGVSRLPPSTPDEGTTHIDPPNVTPPGPAAASVGPLSGSGGEWSAVPLGNMPNRPNRFMPNWSSAPWYLAAGALTLGTTWFASKIHDALQRGAAMHYGAIRDREAWLARHPARHLREVVYHPFYGPYPPPGGFVRPPRAMPAPRRSADRIMLDEARALLRRLGRPYHDEL